MKFFDSIQSFFSSIGEYVKNFSYLFLIFVGAFALLSLVVIFITSFAYESMLTKTIDKINKFLEHNPRINDDNLVAFNNLMKARSVPKALRRQWQQFMLYREHPASYYMSFQHCVENPLRNSAYKQEMTVYKIISYILVALSFVVSVFMAVQSVNSNLVLQDIVIIPMTILIGYWIISMILNLIHNATSGDLFQNYQYFEINMDKAMLTLPDFVDYEVLFSQDEIKRGIPVLFAYLQKRAVQEQQELEKARLKSVDHEKFDFNDAGLDGSLVLDRAMRETENFSTQRKKYMQEIERVNNEITALENNYKEQVKEYQRQVQTSKETVDNLKEQLEQASSTIEINYIKKQIRDEINRQQISEKDFDTTTDKYNQEIKSLNQEIKHYEEETKKAKEALETAMMSEFNTYSVKVYNNLEKIVDDKMQDRVDDFKNQIKGLEGKLEEKNEELENVYTRYQEVLAENNSQFQAPEEVQPEEHKKDKKSKKNKDNADGGVILDNAIYPQEQPQENQNYSQPEAEQYDNQDYQYDNQDYQNEQYDNQDNNQEYQNEQFEQSQENQEQYYPQEQGDNYDYENQDYDNQYNNGQYDNYENADYGYDYPVEAENNEENQDDYVPQNQDYDNYQYDYPVENAEGVNAEDNQYPYVPLNEDNNYQTDENYGYDYPMDDNGSENQIEQPQVDNQEMNEGTDEGSQGNDNGEFVYVPLDEELKAKEDKKSKKDKKKKFKKNKGGEENSGDEGVNNVDNTLNEYDNWFNSNEDVNQNEQPAEYNFDGDENLNQQDVANVNQENTTSASETENPTNEGLNENEEDVTTKAPEDDLKFDSSLFDFDFSFNEKDKAEQPLKENANTENTEIKESDDKIEHQPSVNEVSLDEELPKADKIESEEAESLASSEATDKVELPASDNFEIESEQLPSPNEIENEETEELPIPDEDDENFELDGEESVSLDDQDSSVANEKVEDTQDNDDELPAPNMIRRAGRPRKTISVEDIKPKRSVGRPKKVVEPEDEKPKRSVGRPKKEKVFTETKRSVGRPKKTETFTPKRSVGRPKKEDVGEKKSVGRPRKTEVTEKKNSVGRPRKEKVFTETKRSVGRPKKTETFTSKRSVGRPKKENTSEKRAVGRPRKTENDGQKSNKAKRGRPRK